MGSKGHFYVSLAKSILRIAGFAVMIKFLPYGCIILILAEVLGIVEELVDKR